MVTLSKIYTKTGDDGTTGLGDGGRLKKTHQRVVAYGTVDEANSAIGMIMCQLKDDNEFKPILLGIQNDLFDVGADLCVPEGTQTRADPLRLKDHKVIALEALIDCYNADLPPLNSFILPGGSPVAAAAHLARTIVRRAERETVLLAEAETINPSLVKYLNRLSDLLFVLARRFNVDSGHADPLWQPARD